MPTRDEILDDLTSYTTEQLVQFIKDGTITISDVISDYDFPPKRRDELDAAIKAEATREAEKARIEEQSRIEAQQMALETDWKNCNKKDVEALKAFINKYPNSMFATKAQAIIDEIDDPSRQEPIEELYNKIVEIQNDKDYLNPTNSIIDCINDAVSWGTATRDDILDFIIQDHNLFNSSVIAGLINKKIISYRDLQNICIDDDFLQRVKSGAQGAKFNMPEDLKFLQDRPCTEVYFWGIPSSGKTCALGAILSVAQNGEVAKTMVQDYNCQGYDYMNRLSELFQNGKVNVLPEGTPENAIYEMGFNLTEYNNDNHPITCIDLAGELFRFMYTKEDPELLRILNNIFKSNKKNRKMHFFVIEYGAEERLYEGLPQRVYLNNAVNYIENEGLFDELTDGIYIIVTKSDKADAVGEGRRQAINRYLKEQNYSQFYNRLLDICHKKQINGGELGIIPFSLGDVCFRNLCRFDDSDAKIVVELLLRDTGTDGPSNRFVRKIWKKLKH